MALPFEKHTLPDPLLNLLAGSNYTEDQQKQLASVPHAWMGECVERVVEELRVGQQYHVFRACFDKPGWQYGIRVVELRERSVEVNAPGEGLETYHMWEILRIMQKRVDAQKELEAAAELKHVCG